MSDNRRTGVAKRRIWAIVLVVVVIIVFSAFDISVKTNRVSVTPSTQLQSDYNDLVSGNSSNSIAHYNFRIGFINFTTGNSEISFGYLLRPFNGWNPVYAGPVNFSLGDVPNLFVQILVYQTSWDSSTNPSSVPFILNNVSLASPQGFNGKIETWETVSNTLLTIYINNVGLSPIQSFAASSALGQYPGYHNFYLNFTFTIYSALGPYKIPSQSKTVHLEYNNTIVV